MTYQFKKHLSFSMLQEQQALLQQVLSTQKNMTEKQLAMDKELGILKEKFVNE